MNTRSRLIKSNMTIITYPEYLQIDSARILDLFFIFQALSFYIILLDFPIGDMNVLWINIYVIEQVCAHETIIALQRIIINWIVLVKIKCDNIFETEFLLFMHPYQFGIKGAG